MLEYPADEIDRIIGETMLRQKPDENSGTRDAYERIILLLLSRLAEAWQDPAARRAFEVLAKAEAEMRRFGGSRECLLKTTPELCRKFADSLELCIQAVGACNAARSAWAIRRRARHDDIAMLIADYAQAWDARRQEVLRAAAGRGLLVHASVISQVVEGLQICYLLFMDEDEGEAFCDQITRAIGTLGQCKVFFRPSASDLKQ